MNKSILRILKLAQKGKEGHVPSSLSILDIIETLYKKFISKKIDKFVLSKGHGSLILTNHIYGITKAFQETNFGGKSEACGPEGYSPSDFIKISKAYRIKTIEIRNNSEFN